VHDPWNKVAPARVTQGMTKPGISSARLLAAKASLVASAGGVAALGIARSEPWWLYLGGSAALALAAVGLGRRSVVAQVLARGTAWALCAPSLLATSLLLYYGWRPDLGILGLAATSALALRLARPMLHTETARAEFAPVVYRRWLLAGGVASVAAASACAIASVAGVADGEYAPAAAIFVLGASLLASAIAVVRMRGWGLLLGMANAVAVGIVAMFHRGDEAMSIGALAIPGLMFALPVLVRRAPAEAAPSAARSYPAELAAEPASRNVRVATAPSAGSLDQDLDEVPTEEADERREYARTA